MLGRLAKKLSWLLGGALALALAAYAVLVLANLHDRSPSAEIAAIKTVHDSGSPFLSDRNSYLFVLGFAGAPDADPLALGMERYQWMEQAGPEFDRSGDPLNEEYDFRADRSDAVAQVIAACPESEAECFRILDSEGQAVEQWLADERWLLDRYRSLIDMTEFKEAKALGTAAPLPAYGVILEGQRLHIADAWRSATQADAAAASTALDRDLLYWRMVLENSGTLITKMISTAAIVRHFKLGNLVLRRLPQENAADAIPRSWLQQFSIEERSMRRSLAGEWMFFDKGIKENEDQPVPLASNTWDRVAWMLLQPFWQPQDLSNRQARMMLDLADTFDVPYDEIPEAAGLAFDLQKSVYRPFSRLYNITGDLFMAADYWRISDYAVRVSDLEGVRRAALLVAELRAAGTGADEAATRMRVNDKVDPYTNEPFTWIADEEAIVFHGLDPRKERSRHKLIF